MKKCPYCAEEIQDEAIICRYCQSDLRQPLNTQPPQNYQQPPVYQQPQNLQQYPQNYQQPSYQQTYSMPSDTKKTIFSWLGVIFNFIIGWSLLTPVFSLKISSYYSGVDTSLSPLGILNLLTNYSKWENVIGQGVTALLCAICATIGILSAIAAGFFIKSLIDIYNRSKVSALEHSRFSIKMLLILNAICVGIVIIWNMFADSASQSSSDYFSSAAMKLMKMQFPVSAVVFIVLSIAAIIAINRFIGMSYMIDKQEKQTQAIIQHENVWFCTKCGAKNRDGDSFCSQCGHYK